MQIRTKYNRAAKIYDLIEWPLEKLLFQRWRKKLLGKVRGKVLEIGVGTGKNLPYYDFRKVHLTAVDISNEMLARAKKKAHTLTIFPQFLLLNSERLSFKDHSFDYVISTFVLCSVPDQEQMLLEMKRMVKKSGRILLLEHMRSRNKIVAFVEDLHNPVTVWLLGVNVNRDTAGNVLKCGLKIIQEKNLALGDVFRELEVKR